MYNSIFPCITVYISLTHCVNYIGKSNWSLKYMQWIETHCNSALCSRMHCIKKAFQCNRVHFNAFQWIIVHQSALKVWNTVGSAATFYSVSISKPIPVWFGKKIKILTTCFPNQFQFGLEKNYNFDDSFSKPIPVWFGKNDQFSETKNSKLIPHFFGKT